MPSQPRADEVASKGSWRIRLAIGERIKRRLAGGVDVPLADERMKGRRRRIERTTRSSPYGAAPRERPRIKISARGLLYI